MKRMIASTIRPGATTAAGRLICPFAWSRPPPAATSTNMKVPSISENRRRHSCRGSSKSLRSPNSSASRWLARGVRGTPARSDAGTAGGALSELAKGFPSASQPASSFAFWAANSSSVRIPWDFSSASSLS
jgi:hypothetical protein